MRRKARNIANLSDLKTGEFVTLTRQGKKLAGRVTVVTTTSITIQPKVGKAVEIPTDSDWVVFERVYNHTDDYTPFAYRGAAGGNRPTPWGMSDMVYPITRGVAWFSTPGHGGLAVARGLASKVLTPAARKHGELFDNAFWFEEDVAWAIPFFENPQWQEIYVRKAGGRVYSLPELESMIPQSYFSSVNQGSGWVDPTVGSTWVVKKEIPYSRGNKLRPGDEITVLALTGRHLVCKAPFGKIKLPFLYLNEWVAPANTMPKFAYDERAENEEFEDLAGGMSKAFQMKKLWEAASNATSQYTRGVGVLDALRYPNKANKVPNFILRAQREGFSNEAIAFYVTKIQGESLPRGWKKLNPDKEVFADKWKRYAASEGSVWMVVDPKSATDTDNCWEIKLSRLPFMLWGTNKQEWDAENGALYLKEKEARTDAEARLSKLESSNVNSRFAKSRVKL